MLENQTNPLRSSFIFLIVLGVISISTVGFFIFKSTGDNSEKEILLPRKSSLHHVTEILHEQGVVQYPTLFKVLLRVTGGSSKVRAGEFKFATGSSLWSAMQTLYHGEPVVHAVTVPEGWNIKLIADALAKEGLVSKDKFLKLALSKKSAEKYGFKTPHLEGFLFPETYTFSKVDGEEKILDVMVSTFLSHYNKNFKQDTERLGFTVEKLVTFASIVEKETGQASERPLVASVFHNRLKKHMRLQSDPTTIYGIENFDGNLTKAHLQTPSPYNTYTIPALPLGPIASPGLESLRATLFPADTEYLYFVSNNQGKHIFSKTYGEHSRHVSGYQPVKPKRQRHPQSQKHANRRTR